MLRALAHAAWLIPKIADRGGNQHKRRQDRKRKQRQNTSEGIIKSKEMMPSGDLPNNGNIWQTTEPVKLEKQRYQQVISIIG